jgi:hypothetical protein
MNSSFSLLNLADLVIKWDSTPFLLLKFTMAGPIALAQSRRFRPKHRRRLSAR